MHLIVFANPLENDFATSVKIAVARRTLAGLQVREGDVEHFIISAAVFVASRPVKTLSPGSSIPSFHTIAKVSETTRD
jgi:hypothetical protein